MTKLPFEANRDDNLSALMRQLKSRTFRPKPLRRSYISKGPRSKKRRPLGIPVVRDRVAQDVVRRLLQPVFEPLFHDASFGFRPGRNCHQTIEKALAYHAQGYTYVLDADIETRATEVVSQAARPRACGAGRSAVGRRGGPTSHAERLRAPPGSKNERIWVSITLK